MIKKAELDFFLEYAGKPYDKNNNQHQEARKRILNGIFSQKNLAMEMAAKKLFPALDNNDLDISGLDNVHSPSKKNIFRNMLYQKFSPKNKFSRLVDYWFNLTGNKFVISLGIKHDISSKNLKFKSEKLNSEFKIENSMELTKDITEEELANWIVNSVNDFDLTYYEFCNKLQPELDEDFEKNKIKNAKDIDYQEEKNKDMNEQKKNSKNLNRPLNQILYGPPGTGKTYRTMRLAVDICSETKIPDEKLVQEYEKLKKANRISFITFHQSFSYEDFVEGIRPNLNEESEIGGISYKIQDGIFKKICQLAKASQGISSSGRNIDISKNKIYKMSLGNSKNPEEDNIYEDCLKNNYVRLGWGGGIDYTECNSISKVETKYKQDRNPEAKKQDFNITAINYLKNEMKKGDLVIISDGNLKFRAIGRINGEYQYLKGNDDYVQMRPVEWLAIFADSLPVETILSNRLSQMSIYQPNPRSIKIEALERLLNASKQNFVLIIDEINRANISKVFGELITLIEKSKRSSKDNPGLSVTLPYSQVEDFSVPDNLYIIGTMNSADRSIALLDTALRRRFEFKELMPRPELLENNIGDISLSKLLSKINERIEHLYDRDHTIGHAYLMDDVKDIEGLRNTFRYKIIPLLQEYFYDDWENIKRVLNDKGNFIIEGESELDSDVKKNYSINQNEFSEEAFLAIYQ
jgi:5-methylcytosine-specific restriction enzyme B